MEWSVVSPYEYEHCFPALSIRFEIHIFVKYQTLDIEFLVIWLALYSRYKWYIL